MIEVKGKVLVVTGSAGLLGSVIVSTLREAGARVIEADIQNSDEEGADKFHFDITSDEAIANLLDKLYKKYGRIDGWLNNAYPRTADWGKTDLESEPMESWRKNIDMHLNGYTSAARLVANKMKAQSGGSIINMSSIYGSVGPDFSVYEGTDLKNPAAYAAIKGALVNLSRYMAAYYGPYGVRVNCISPGGIFNHQPEAFVQAYNKKVPLRRMGKAEDIAHAVLYLFSDASSYVTGHNLMVDGGWTAI